MKFLENTAKYGLMVVLFAPLVITTSTFFPFVFGKAVFFQVVVEAVFFIWLFLYLNEPQKYKPRVSKLGLSIFAFLLVLFIASVLGVDPARSIWGNFERMEGWVSLAHFGIFFFLASVFWQKKRDWVHVLRTFISVGVISVFYGLAQQWELPFVVSGGGSALAGPLGNTTLFGSFLLLPAGLAAFLFFWDKRRKWRFYYGFAFGLLAAGVGLTGAQGPTAGLILGIVLFLILGLLFYEKKEYKSYFVGLGVLILIAGSLFVVFIDSNFAQESPVLSKFTNFSFQSGSFKSRFLNWKITWRGIKESPFLGYGQEGNLYVYMKNFDPDVLAYSDSWFDKPHNKYLEVAASSGFLGLASYLSIFFFAFLYLKRNKNLPALARLVLFGLLFGYLIQLGTLFDTTASYLGIFLVLAFINRLAFDKDRLRKERDEAKQAGLAFPLRCGLGLFLAAGFGLTAYHINLEALMASRKALMGTHYLKTARIFKNRNHSKDEDPYLDRAYEEFKKSANWHSFGQEQIASQLGVKVVNFSSHFKEEKMKPFLAQSKGELKKAIEKHPRNARLYLVLGDTYLALDKTRKAAESFKRVRKLVPKRPGAYYKLSEIYFDQGEENKALQSANKALELNKNYARSWKYRGGLNFELGNSKQGLRDFLKAFQAGLNWKEVAKTQVNSKEDFESLAVVLERYLRAAPNDAKMHASLSFFYIKLGEEEKAVDHYNRAVEIKPQMSAEFIKYLPKKNSL